MLHRIYWNNLKEIFCFLSMLNKRMSKKLRKLKQSDGVIPQKSYCLLNNTNLPVWYWKLCNVYCFVIEKCITEVLLLCSMYSCYWTSDMNRSHTDDEALIKLKEKEWGGIRQAKILQWVRNECTFQIILRFLPGT